MFRSFLEDKVQEIIECELFEYKLEKEVFSLFIVIPLLLIDDLWFKHTLYIVDKKENYLRLDILI